MDRMTHSRNRRMLVGLFGLVFGMVGLSFAAVPLYDLFCRVTGYGGATNTAEAGSERVLDETIKIRFDASLERNMPWRFTPITIYPLSGSRPQRWRHAFNCR